VIIFVYACVIMYRTRKVEEPKATNRHSLHLYALIFLTIFFHGNKFSLGMISSDVF
jgi:hypothetical protein